MTPNPLFERRLRGKCGKICFDKRTAQTKRNQLLEQGHAKYLRIYDCLTCNAWHLTHKPLMSPDDVIEDDNEAAAEDFDQEDMIDRIPDDNAYEDFDDEED